MSSTEGLTTKFKLGAESEEPMLMVPAVRNCTGEVAVIGESKRTALVGPGAVKATNPAALSAPDTRIVAPVAPDETLTDEVHVLAAESTIEVADAALTINWELESTPPTVTVGELLAEIDSGPAVIEAVSPITRLPLPLSTIDRGRVPIETVPVIVRSDERTPMIAMGPADKVPSIEPPGTVNVNSESLEIKPPAGRWKADVVVSVMPGDRMIVEAANTAESSDHEKGVPVDRVPATLILPGDREGLVMKRDDVAGIVSVPLLRITEVKRLTVLPVAIESDEPLPVRNNGLTIAPEFEKVTETSSAVIEIGAVLNGMRDVPNDTTNGPAPEYVRLTSSQSDATPENEVVELSNNVSVSTAAAAQEATIAQTRSTSSSTRGCIAEGARESERQRASEKRAREREREREKGERARAIVQAVRAVCTCSVYVQAEDVQAEGALSNCTVWRQITVVRRRQASAKIELRYAVHMRRKEEQRRLCGTLKDYKDGLCSVSE